MADATGECSQELKDDDKTKRNILEEKSKDELIKLVKKYLNLLQKSKNKTDVLNEKCSALECEKSSLKKTYQSKEEELQNKLDDHQHTISELKAEKATLSESVLENELLKEKLKQAEDKIQTLLLQENEEQLQCLSLQLQTLKASCQCIQEENHKLQTLYKEKLEEISLLADKHTALSSDFKKKVEEYDLLFSVKENTQAKYELSIEEIHSLQAEIKKLMNENNSLQASYEKLSFETEELRNYNKDSKSSDLSILLVDLQKYQDENEKLKKQIQAQNKSKSNSQKSQITTESEIDTSSLKKASSELQNEVYNALLKEKLSLQEENKTLQSELDKCQQQILELQSEIKNIVNSHELGDYKMGIEFALLQGASSDKIICPVEPINSRNEVSQFKSSGVAEKNTETFENKHYPFEGASGLEYSLLQGGDASKFISGNTRSVNEVYDMYLPYNEAFNPAPELNSDNSAISYNELLEKYDLLSKEKKNLQKNLAEYSNLCHDTIKENDELKQELESFKSFKVICHQQTNTESEYYPEEAINSDVSTDNTVIPENRLESCEDCNILRNEIASFYGNIQSRKELHIEREMPDIDHLSLLNNIKKLFEQIATELEKKKSELNDYNLQLELLVIGVKQGVRQKNSSYQAENNIDENINALKMLLEDLLSRSSYFDSKLKMVQSETSNKTQEMEDQINQLKELNQFLEDENSELSIEVDKLKSSLKDLNNCTEVTYLQNTELYSIDESCEFDNRTDANCDVKLDKENINTCDISVQAFPLIQNCSVQVEADYGKEDKVTEDVNIQTDFKSETCKIIEQLKNDNESLKNIAQEKSNLVENIHCQMDSLLIKVEELTVELQNKEDDLKHMKYLSADLEKKLSEAENTKNQQINLLKAVQDLVLDCKREKNDLSDDVKSFSSTFKDLISNTHNEILNVIDENGKNINCVTEMCNHKAKTLTIVQNWILDLAVEYEHWLNFMDQMTLESSLELSEIAGSVENASSNLLFDKMCHESACCAILENISNLNSYKFKLFSAFYNHLNNNYNPLVKEIRDYKMDIIPKMEKKLAECTCRNESKIQVAAENLQFQEESLKNTLADTEMKMNKFKQIAVKLKKELASVKEQFNAVTSEKEKLLKQNTELLDELNKLTEDQCKYVQNYQTLQKEFDKVQDDCEMHKCSLKKLEDDLALKLRELASIKDQVVDLEGQLKSSKNLLENNLAVKKDLDSKCAELESKIIILESKISEKEQKLTSKDMEIAKCLKDLSTAQEDNKHLKNQLELAQKEGNKKSLLDLEMADFERSITELNNKIKKKEDEIEELQKEIQLLKEKNDCLHEELKTTESLKEVEAKRAESLREILEKTKSELNEAKEHETELLSKTASLEVRLESMIQHEENLKIQLSETSAQIQNFQDVIKTSSDNHQRIVRSLEQKISNQKEEIIVAHKEVESVKQEFENYKIRVHSVLKQQKSCTPAIASVDSDLKEKLETVNEKLKLQVKELSEKLTAMSLEYDALQEEHGNLLQRYDKLVEDKDRKDKEWNQRLELINAEKSRLRVAQEELSSQHLLQNEMLVATYKKQIKIMSEEHKKIVNDLQKQLDAADVEISRLQRDQQKLQGLPVTPSPQDSTTSFDLLSQERQEGEGSENTDETNTPIKRLSLATIPTSGFLPLEKLLQSPIEPGTPASYMSTYDPEKLALDLNTANKKIDHLSELLNDTESTNLRLSEQIRVLKDEVRRLENNKERQQHAENLEYLKNVFIKFATLQPGSERAMLVPVLTTMLKLNSSEQQQLKSVAGDAQSDDNMNSGWGSYLHRWSGLS